MTYPVLHLDLNAEKYDSPEALNKMLELHLDRWEDTYGKRGSETTLSGRFANIIRHANQQTGRQVVNTKDYIYVFEFKLDGSAFDALEQIEHTGYQIPYTADRRQLVKVGVSFDAGERNIGEWEIENGK